jgi:hypothetical protein
VIEPVVPFTQKQIEGPVIVHMIGGVIPGRGVYGDEVEMDQIHCTGRIVSTRQLVVQWTSKTLVRGLYNFVFMMAT